MMKLCVAVVAIALCASAAAEPLLLTPLLQANKTAERFMGVLWFGYPSAGSLAATPTPPRKKGLAGVLKMLE